MSRTTLTTTTTSKTSTVSKTTSTSRNRLVIAAAALPPAHEAIEHAQAAADALHHFLSMATTEATPSSSFVVYASSLSIHAAAVSIGDLADAAAATATSSSAAAAAAASSASSNNNDWLAPVANSLETTLTFFQKRLESAGVPYSYGWAIILLTAATKVVTFPFTRKQVESALAVQKLKPAIDDIKRQYGEADKESVQRETSALYEKAGVDPAAGCLPTLLTLPIFWGLYRALTNVAASGDASVVDQGFYWVPSLSGPTTVEAQRAGTGTSWLLPLVDGAPPGGWEHAAPYLVLPVLLVLAQYASSAIISPTSSSDSSSGDDEGAGAQFSKALVALLPLLVGWFALNVPSGIALYYFANTVLTSAVQIWLRKLGGATAFEFQQEIGVSQAKRSESGSVGGKGGEASVAGAHAAAAAVAPAAAGEVGALEAAWLLDFDAAAVVEEAMAAVSSAPAAAAAAAEEASATTADSAAAAAAAPAADGSENLSEEELEARKAAAALAALPVTTRSKRRRAGGLPEGAASRLAEEDEREREREEKEKKGVGAGLIAAVTGKK